MVLQCPSSLRSIEDIHEWLNRCAIAYEANQAGENLYVDLSSLRWVSPIGCSVLLASLIRLDQAFYLKTSIPERNEMDGYDVIGYMERMDFFKFCPEDVRKSFELSLDMASYYNRNRNNKKNSLNELTVSVSDEDVIALHHSVREIMKDKELPQNRISDITRIATELGNNAIEHGHEDQDTPCISCIQYYKKRNKVEIAICDTGMGIVHSLKNYVSYTDNDDIVRQAILTKASRLIHQERGKGLVDVKNITFTWSSDAEFYVRTHDSIYRIHNDDIERIEQGSYFFGTYFYIVIHT